MKLRIQGNSLRLRITPSEIARLMETGRVDETIHFGLDETARLNYALQCEQQPVSMLVRQRPGELVVVVSRAEAGRWASTQDVGMYGELETSSGALLLAVEKDFACLDKSDDENTDRFPNPRQGSKC